MPSSIMQRLATQCSPINPQASSIINAINQVKSMSGGNIGALYSSLYNSNPQFKAFADSMHGKTAEQAFKENGLDYNQVRGLF